MILVCTHKEFAAPKIAGYQVIFCGSQDNLQKNNSYLLDNTGENISHKNENFCELTAIYWAWENDYFDEIASFCHYRRFFAGEENYEKHKIISELEISQILQSYDIILAKPRNYFIFTVEQQYKFAHYSKDFEKLRFVIAQKYPEYLQAFEKVAKSRKLSLYNCFAMRKNLFNQYSEFIFSVLFDIEKELDISNYDAYQKRVFGFLAERLLNVFVEKNNLNVYYRKIVTTEKSKFFPRIKKYFVK
ncbi:MAG: DUF4422 domain-containing protein [Cardiobacteriaceae bacterium]|nr:DUF4422 domain-containing protein [Cardiobacteriaceae bacterium]